MPIHMNPSVVKLSDVLLDGGRRHGLVVVLLLAEDLELQELLLLLQEACVRRVHRYLVGLLLLVWRDVLVVL